MGSAPDLFGPDVPPGFEYRGNFVTETEEALLLAAIGGVVFADFEMRGVVARRRVAFFGQSYDRRASGPLPAFLIPLRSRLAQWAGMDDEAFAMALINEYPPGAPIGWHRDAPQYGIVAGVSLLSSCRMKFRPYRRQSSTADATSSRRSATHEVVLESGSAYLMARDARQSYEHHIPPVTNQRYSVTFRTLR